MPGVERRQLSLMLDAPALPEPCCCCGEPGAELLCDGWIWEAEMEPCGGVDVVDGRLELRRRRVIRSRDLHRHPHCDEPLCFQCATRTAMHVKRSDGAGEWLELDYCPFHAEQEAWSARRIVIGAKELRAVRAEIRRWNIQAHASRRRAAMALLVAGGADRINGAGGRRH